MPAIQKNSSPSLLSFERCIFPLQTINSSKPRSLLFLFFSFSLSPFPLLPFLTAVLFPSFSFPAAAFLPALFHHRLLILLIFGVSVFFSPRAVRRLHCRPAVYSRFLHRLLLPVLFQTRQTHWPPRSAVFRVLQKHRPTTHFPCSLLTAYTLLHRPAKSEFPSAAPLPFSRC